MSTFVLDGRTVEAAGSLLDVILAEGIDIPHLCKDDNLPAIGACRTCLVEVDGRVVASCSVPATSVRHVSTDSPRAVALRNSVLELTTAMVAPLEAGRAGPEGETLSRVLALSSADFNRFDHRSGEHRDATNPFFSFDETACILCGRCVVACQVLQHISAIGIAGHGRGSRVTPDAAAAWGDSTCTSCGSCVATCPTHALVPTFGGD